MKAPFRWTFPIVAVLATLVALAADTNDVIAIPAAACAVAAAGFAFWDSVRTPAPATAAAPSLVPADPGGGSELWLRGGAMGQEAIVLLLDRIDRALYHPELPTRNALELARISGLSREAFLGYVESRMGELEAPS